MGFCLDCGNGCFVFVEGVREDFLVICEIKGWYGIVFSFCKMFFGLVRSTFSRVES